MSTLHDTATQHAHISERRSEPRPRTLKSGKIVFNNNFAVLDCIVRNMHMHGACLEVASTLGVPAIFDLVLADGHRHACNLRWRYDKRVGVEFAA